MKKILKNLHLEKIARKIFITTKQIYSVKKWHYIKKNDRIWLDLGSGKKKGKNGWTTVDRYGADICYDLKKGIPLPSNSVEKIYTSHMFEHIPYKELVIFINECYRVLKKGGELSVFVPNSELYITAYIEKKFFGDNSQKYLPAIVDTGSLMDQINYIA